MSILAADPGLKGAFAFRSAGHLIVQDMPTYTRAAGTRKTDRDFLDEAAVWRAMQAYYMLGAEVLFIEQVGGLPGQSASAAFTFGQGYGAVVMAARAVGLRIEYVRPQEWKGKLRVPSDKRASSVRATELMPEHAELWTARRGHLNQEHAIGRADAAMIALYAERHMGGAK